MSKAAAIEMTRKLTAEGGPLDYGPEQSGLMLRVLRAVAAGQPVCRRAVDGIALELGMTPDDAWPFLGQLTERNPHGDIVGILGLSLNQHRHRFSIKEVQLSTWCALDTLFLPSLLGQPAVVESPSPVSQELVRVVVGPAGVEKVSPAGAVVSIVVVDAERANMRSVEDIWTSFCRHIHFFASREEAEHWAAGRRDIAILSVAEGYEVGEVCVKRLLTSGTERTTCSAPPANR
ncbi:MAG: organomercurial lyase [Candidatus Rokuibacteriota bacterium]